MSTQQARHAIMHAPPSPAPIDRAARLLEAIKLETRWLLVSTRTRDFRLNDSDYAADRAQFVGTWPGIRHRRVPAAYLAAFHDLVADQASMLTHLIEIRRQRARKASQ